jgi:hypothetical protein
MLSVKVLSIGMNSPCSKINASEEGAYGHIYFIPFLKHEIAIKSFDFSKVGVALEWLTSKSMEIIFEEYCIALISSILRCGPKMYKYCGFDLLVFNNRVEFMMEKCIPL